MGIAKCGLREQDREQGKGPGWKKAGVVFCCLLFVPLLPVVGCSPKIKGKTTLDAYKEGMGEGAGEEMKKLQEAFKREQPFGYAEPYKPLMMPPEQIEVWVAPHAIGNDIFVPGHYIYYKLKDWRWNPDLIRYERESGAGERARPLPLHPEAKPQSGQ